MLPKKISKKYERIEKKYGLSKSKIFKAKNVRVLLEEVHIHMMTKSKLNVGERSMSEQFGS